MSNVDHSSAVEDYERDAASTVCQCFHKDYSATRRGAAKGIQTLPWLSLMAVRLDRLWKKLQKDRRCDVDSVSGFNFFFVAVYSSGKHIKHDEKDSRY